MAADLAMECIQDYIHPDDETLQSTIEMTPGFKPLTYCAFCSPTSGPPIPRLLVIFFFFRATDPISGNAFDARQKKGGDGLTRNNQLQQVI